MISLRNILLAKVWVKGFIYYISEVINGNGTRGNNQSINHLYWPSNEVQLGYSFKYIAR